MQKEVALRVKSNTGTQEDTDFLTNIKIGTETVENIADKIIYKSNLTTTVISRAVGLMRTYTKQEAKIIKEAFTLELLA